jgi:outer membrane protein TolC
MRLVRPYVLAGVLSVALPCYALAATPSATTVVLDFLTLPQQVESSNLQVQSAATRVLAAQAREGYLFRNSLPQLGLTGGFERYKKGRTESDNNPYGGVEATLNLYNGGRDSLEDQRRLNQREAAAAEAQLTVRDQLLAARLAYIEGDLLTKLGTLLNQEQEMQRTHRSAAQKRIQAGLSTAADRLDFDLRLKELARTATANHHEIAHARQTLALLVGQAKASSMTVAALPPLASLDAERLLNNPAPDASLHPEVAKLNAEATDLALAARQEGRALLPKVEAYAGYAAVSGLEEAGSFSDRREGNVGLRLRVPLFDGGNAKQEALALQRQYQAAQLNVQAVANQVAAEVMVLRQHWDNLSAQAKDNDEALRLATQLHAQVLKEYRVGNKSSRDVLDATQRLFEARREQAVNQHDQYATLVRLEHLQGAKLQPETAPTTATPAAAHHE